jgi:hypothetical protein
LKGHIIDIVKFNHNDKTYEIRVICDGDTVYVKAFLNNKPANRYRYSATLKNATDIKKILGIDAVNYLIEKAKQDIIDGIE